VIELFLTFLLLNMQIMLSHSKRPKI